MTANPKPGHRILFWILLANLTLCSLIDQNTERAANDFIGFEPYASNIRQQSLAGKGAGGLGLMLIFPNGVKSQH